MVARGGGRQPEIIGATEAARLLGLSVYRVPQLAREGKLACELIVGRRVYKRGDVLALKRARGKRRR